jgi:hypothetical protein
VFGENRGYIDCEQSSCWPLARAASSLKAEPAQGPANCADAVAEAGEKSLMLAEPRRDAGFAVGVEERIAGIGSGTT